VPERPEHADDEARGEGSEAVDEAWKGEPAPPDLLPERKDDGRCDERGLVRRIEEWLRVPERVVRGRGDDEKGAGQERGGEIPPRAAPPRPERPQERPHTRAFDSRRDHRRGSRPER